MKKEGEKHEIKWKRKQMNLTYNKAEGGDRINPNNI